MSWSRPVRALTAALAVAGCAVVAIGMAHATSPPQHRRHVLTVPSATPRPAYLPLTVSPSTAAPRTTPRTTPPPNPTPTSLHPSAAPLTTSSRAAPAGRPALAGPGRPRTSEAASTAPGRAREPARDATLRSTYAQVRTERHLAPQVRGGRLPLRLRTHDAGQVITVVARSRHSTVATLQAWRRVRGGGWLRVGPRIRARIGADGMTWHPSESKSATPRGSYTLTHAFGRRADPGTALPYLHTNPADWWISQAGRLYNTHQRCWSRCPFTQGAPNEHLYYETPYYNYAVVIDYNTRNAPGGVRQGRGSAFFLHVTVGQPTAGCVAIRKARLVSIMRWLAPRKHPRILIGVG